MLRIQDVTQSKPVRSVSEGAWCMWTFSRIVGMPLVEGSQLI